MNEPRGHYAEVNKPDTERQIFYDVIYMWHLKQSNPLIHRIEWWLSGSGEREKWRNDD